MTSKYIQSKTPIRALKLSEMDPVNYWTGRKQIPDSEVATAPPLMKALRLTELLAEMVPPSSRNNVTSVKRSLRKSAQKYYMSTSKKNANAKKSENTVVRRALNFISTNQQLDNLQMHPKSQPINKKVISSFKSVPEKNNQACDSRKFLYLSKETAINTKIEKKLPVSVSIQAPTTFKTNSLNVQSNSHNYELRSQTSIQERRTSPLVFNEQSFKQYRNDPNNSLNESSFDQPSPQITQADKSIVDYHKNCQANVSNSDISNVLCDALSKTNLSSTEPNICDALEKLNNQMTTNLRNATSTLKMLNSISDEINKNTNLIISCIETNKQAIEMSQDLINRIKRGESLHLNKKRTSIPMKKTIITPLLTRNQSSTVTNYNSVSSKSPHQKILPDITNLPSNNYISSKYNRNSLKPSDLTISLCHDLEIKKENVSPTGEGNVTPKVSPNNIIRSITNGKSDKRYDLRRTVLKSSVEVNASSPVKYNIGSPKQTHSLSGKRILSPKNKLFSPKVKQSSPKNVSRPKSPFVNFVVPGAGKNENTKSMQMYKTLKDNIKLLKTPVGKGKSTNINLPEFDTPNTKCRNITSNNIKRQLESLYDDENT